MQERYQPPAAPDRATHLDLLAIAGQVRRAAEHDDVEELHAELGHLRTALEVHLEDERGLLDRLPATAGAIARDGQRRLLRLLTEALAEGEGPTGCTCIVRTAEIELAVRRQADLEAALLRRHLDRSPPGQVARRSQPTTTDPTHPDRSTAR